MKYENITFIYEQSGTRNAFPDNNNYILPRAGTGFANSNACSQPHQHIDLHPVESHRDADAKAKAYQDRSSPDPSYLHTDSYTDLHIYFHIFYCDNHSYDNAHHHPDSGSDSNR